MSKADPIDPSVPAGSEDPKLGDNRIRELARAVIELINVDHYVGTDGGAGTGYDEDAAGQHLKATLRAGSDPTSVANAVILYCKDVASKAEAHLKDEDGNVIQLTAAGILKSLNLTGDQTVAGTKTFSSQIISSLAQGTPPLAVQSETKVTKLNADKWDGNHVVAYTGGQSYTFPGGLIIKMGNQACASRQDYPVVFTNPFPNAVLAVVLGPQWNSNGNPYMWQIKTTGVASFVFRVNAASGGERMNWAAIGW